MVNRQSRKYERAYARALIDIYEGRYHGDGTRFSRSRIEQEAYADAIINTYGTGLDARARQPGVMFQRSYAGCPSYGGGPWGHNYGYSGGYQSAPLQAPITLVLQDSGPGCSGPCLREKPEKGGLNDPVPVRMTRTEDLDHGCCIVM